LAESIYLAVPLIGDRDMESARKLAEIIERLGHEVVSRWVIASDPGWGMNPDAVYRRDAQGVRECDGLVAEVSTPSHGVGMEIMLAHMLGKKVICACKKGAKLSRLLQGMPGIVIIEYGSFEEMEAKLRSQLV
jgi:nucleoside 2-deoxyribosyltransferase